MDNLIFYAKVRNYMYNSPEGGLVWKLLGIFLIFVFLALFRDKNHPRIKSYIGRD